MHWKLKYTLFKIKEYFQQIWYCHHNARVLADFEYRMACVLDQATGSRISKPYYSVDVMVDQILLYQCQLSEESYKEGYEDAKEEYLTHYEDGYRIGFEDASRGYTI